MLALEEYGLWTKSTHGRTAHRHVLDGNHRKQGGRVWIRIALRDANLASGLKEIAQPRSREG